MKGYNELMESVAQVDLPGLEAFLVSGPDALDWLQGQLTNDVRLLENLDWLDSCLVKSTGQLEGTVRLVNSEDGLVALTAFGGVLSDRFEKFVILEDVALTPLGLVNTSLQGPDSQSVAPKGAWRSPRTGSDGWESLDPPNAFHGIVADFEAVSLTTLEMGLPIVGVDSNEKTLPPELGPSFTRDHVAFTKGCYVGQEVLQRIHSRGHTNKEWGVYAATAEITAGENVLCGGKAVGVVTRAAQRASGEWLCGAMVRHQSLGTLVTESGAELSQFNR